MSIFSVNRSIYLEKTAFSTPILKQGASKLCRRKQPLSHQAFTKFAKLKKQHTLKVGKKRDAKHFAPLTPQPHSARFWEYNSTKWRNFWNTTPQNSVKFGIRTRGCVKTSF